MKFTKLLRICIIAEIFFIIFEVILELLLENSLPTELLDYIARTDKLDITFSQWLSLGICVPLIALLIVSWIGLFRLWRPSRFLYTLCCVLGLSLYPLLEPVVFYTPYGAMISDLSMTNTGLILGIIFLTPLKSHFEKQKPNPSAGKDAVSPPRS